MLNLEVLFGESDKASNEHEKSLFLCFSYICHILLRFKGLFTFTYI